MSDLTEALRRAAARPSVGPSVTELRQELHHRHRRRRVAVGVMSGIGVIAASAVLVASLQADRQRTVRTTGAPVTPTTVQEPSGRAHVGDGFCEPQLTAAGYQITAADPGVVSAISEQAAIEQARAYVHDGNGRYSAYFAMVGNPVLDKVGLGPPNLARPTWVVEVSDIVPPPPTDASSAPTRRGGAPDPNLYPSYQMVAFIDDATGTRAGAWAACYDEPSTIPVDVPVPNLLGRQVGEAAAALAQLGLTVVIHEEHTPDVARGLVMTQTPLPGSVVPGASAVTVVVSAGP